MSTGFLILFFSPLATKQAVAAQNENFQHVRKRSRHVSPLEGATWQLYGLTVTDV